MFYYELKLYWMEVVGFIKDHKKKFHICTFKKKFSNHLRIDCEYLEIEIIVPLSFFLTIQMNIKL
jgi:hypothetical protein